MYRQIILLQLQVLDMEGLRMTDWFNEVEIIVNDDPRGIIERITSKMVRRQIYFATDRHCGYTQCLRRMPSSGI